MRIQLGSGKGKKDNSLKLFHGEAASSAMENAACAYQAPSVIAAGASAQGVAFLTCLANLFLSVLLLKVPGLVEGKLSSLKRTTLIISIVSTLSWLPLIFVTFFLKNASPLLIIALWIVNLVPTTLVYPLRDNWLASLIPSDKMGRYLGLRSITSGVTYLVTFYLMGFVLDKTIVNNIRGYAYILALAFLATAISNLFYTRIRAPATPVVDNKKHTLNLISFLKETKKSYLGTFILFVAMYTFSVNLASPLFAAYMLGELKLGYMTFTAIMSCEYVARILSLSIWGKHIDRVGSLKVLNIVSYFIPFIPIFWLFSTNFIYLLGIQLISGIVWAAFDLSVQTFVYKATPPDQRLRYIVYYRSVTTASIALGAVTGGLLINHMFSIFGSQILGLFAISGILRMAVAKLMLPKLTLQGIPEAAINPELAKELVAIPAVARVGLYHYPDTWKYFTGRSKATGSNVIGRAFNTSHLSTNGLFYKPAKWAEYRNKAQPQPVMAESRDTAQPVHERRYLHHEYQQVDQLQQTESTPYNKGDRNISRNGLFYNPHLWGDFLKQSMVLNATTMRTGGDGAVLRQPVFYHPEIWQRYRAETAGQKANAREKTTGRREALFYNPEKWQTYGAQSAFSKNRKASPQMSLANTVVMRIPQYRRPTQAVDQTKEKNSGATVHQVYGISRTRPFDVTPAAVTA